MYGFVSGVFLCGLRATRLTEKNALGFASSSARCCSMKAYTAGLCLPWRMLAPITIASKSAASCGPSSSGRTSAT